MPVWLSVAIKQSTQSYIASSISAWVIWLCTCYKTKSATETISKLTISLGVFIIIIRRIYSHASRLQEFTTDLQYIFFSNKLSYLHTDGTVILQNQLGENADLLSRMINCK